MSDSRRIVVIDDEPAFAATLKKMLDSFGYEVATATDAPARHALNLGDRDIVFIDIRTPEFSWQQLFKQLARQQTKAAIVMMGSQFEHLEEAEKFARKIDLISLAQSKNLFDLMTLETYYRVPSAGVHASYCYH